MLVITLISSPRFCLDFVWTRSNLLQNECFFPSVTPWRPQSNNIPLLYISQAVLMPVEIPCLWFCRSCNGAYAKVRASLATALMRGKSIHALYGSLWFVPCLLVVCLLLKRFFSSLARLAGSSATHTLRKNICWFFSWLVIGEGPELLDVGGQSSIAPLRRVTCRRSKSQSL